MRFAYCVELAAPFVVENRVRCTQRLSIGSRIGAISGYLQKHRIERRLRQLVYHHFNETYTSSGKSEKHLLAEMPHSLRREVHTLRRTTVAGMGELKEALAEVRELTQRVAERLDEKGSPPSARSLAMWASPLTNRSYK